MKAVYMFAYADKYAYYVESWLEWTISRIDCDDVLNYSPTIHTFANLEQLLTDSMAPMLDVKLDHRHCSSTKCPTIMSIGTIRTCSYIIVLHCCLVYDYRSLIRPMCLRLRATTYMSEFAPAAVFFSSTSILMPVSCFDKHTYVMPHFNRAVLSSKTWLVGLPYYGLVTSPFPFLIGWPYFQGSGRVSLYTLMLLC